MTLIIPVGASGAGKSRLYNLQYSDSALVCMDNIREDLTGNISDQSRNKEVAAIAKQQTYEYADQDRDTYISATNLSIPVIRSSIDEAYKSGNLEKVVILFLSDSENPELLISRVKGDLSNNVNRSDVPEDIIRSMSDRYKKLINSSDTKALVKAGYDNIDFEFKVV